MWHVSSNYVYHLMFLFKIILGKTEKLKKMILALYL